MAKGKRRKQLKELAKRGGSSVAKRMKEKTTKWLLLSDGLAGAGGYLEGKSGKSIDQLVTEGWMGMTKLEAVAVAAHVGGWMLNKPEVQIASAGGVGHYLWRKGAQQGMKASPSGGRPPAAGTEGEAIEGDEETSGSVEVEG